MPLHEIKKKILIYWN